MSQEETLIQFPCDFKIKIIGKNLPQFEGEIVSIVRKHFPQMSETAIRSNTSQNQSYLAITATVYAKNKPELDQLYQELSSHPDVQMVL